MRRARVREMRMAIWTVGVCLLVNNPLGAAPPTTLPMGVRNPLAFRDVHTLGRYGDYVDPLASVNTPVPGDFGLDVVWRINGGSIRGVAASGDHTVITTGQELQVLDLRDPTEPRILGRATLPGFLRHVVLSGNIAYVVAGDAGVRVVDVSNPRHPKEVASMETGGHVRDVAVSNAVMCLIDQSNEVEVFDVHDPVNPALLHRMTLPGAPAETQSDPPRLVEMWHQYAYFHAADTLRVYDMSDPSAPVETATLAISSFQGVHMSVSNGILAVDTDSPWPGGNYLIDVRSPYAPVVHDVSAKINTKGFVKTFELHGTRLWVGQFFKEGMTVDVYDVTTLDSPTFMGQIGLLPVDREDRSSFSDVPVQVAVSGDYAYVATNGERLYIVNQPALRPLTLERLGGVSWPYTTGGGDHVLFPTDVAVSGSYAYVYNGAQGGLRIIDFSTPQEPQPLGAYMPDSFPPYGAAGFEIASGVGVVYLGVGAILRTIDVADPTAPQQVHSLRLPLDNILDVIRDGNRLVIAGDVALCVLDVTQPQKPKLVGTLTGSDGYLPGRRVAVDGPSVFVATPPLGVQMIDIADPAQPKPGWTLTPPANRRLSTGPTLDVECTNGWLYMANSDDLWIVDVRDRHHPLVRTSLPTATLYTDLAVLGSILYAYDGSSIEAIDVRAPSAPVRIASGRSSATGIAADGCYVYTTISVDDGLSVNVYSAVHYTDTALAGHYDVPLANWLRATMDGDALYTYVSPNRVVVLNANTPSLSDTLYVHHNVREFIGARDGTLLIDRSGVLQIIDVRDARHPRLVAETTLGDDMPLLRLSGEWRGDAENGIAVVLPPAGRRLYVVDYRDSGNVREGSVDNIAHFPDFIENIVIDQGFAYVTDSRNQLMVVDVTNIDSLSTHSTIPLNARLIAVKNGIVYATTGDSMLVFDDRRRGDPLRIGGVETFTRRHTVGGDIVYGLGKKVPSDNVFVAAYSLRNPADPIPVGVQTIANVNRAWNLVLVANDKMAFVYDRLFNLVALRLSEAVAVTLQQFDATSDAEQVTLSWRVAEQDDITGYRVLRGAGAGDARDATVVAEVNAHPGKRYEVTDRAVVEGGTYRYTLVALTAGGVEIVLGERIVEVPTPQRVALGQNKPNPFNPSTRIRLRLPRTMETELVVCDTAGRRVATLYRGRMTAGVHELAWDGRNNNGQRVASGVYMYRLKAGRRTLTRKMVMLK